MGVVRLASPTIWALALTGLLVLGYVAYQVRGYRLLCRQHRRLSDLRVGQRQVYRSLEACQGCFEALLGRVPEAARPAPYTEDDQRAIALRAELEKALDGLLRGLRPLEAGPAPRLSAGPLVTGHYYRTLAARTEELEFARGLRREVAAAEAAIDELEAVLARLASKPLEVERALADLEGMAAALVEEIELERRGENHELEALLAEARAVGAAAQANRTGLLAAREGEAPSAAIEAEAARRQLVARLGALYREVGTIAGSHDHAQRGLERLDAALAAIDGRLDRLRPALAAVLRPQAQALADLRRVLEESYRRRSVEAYEEVARQAWALVAQARALDQQHRRVQEADERAGAAVAECSRDLAELGQQVQDSERETRARLDLSRQAVARAAALATEMRGLWAGEEGHVLPADPPSIVARLGEVEVLAGPCRQELQRLRDLLAAWRTQRTRALAVLARVLDHCAREQVRMARAWQALQGYERANWAQIDEGCYAAFGAERDDVVAAATEARRQFARGEVAESALGDLIGRCEELDARRARLEQEAQRVSSALNAVRATERQVLEAIAALRGDVEWVAATERELPAGVGALADLREIGRDIETSLARLDEGARSPATTDLRRLREEKIPRLHERLAVYRLTHARLLEDERAALRRRLVSLWERWEPLSLRLAKARPATEVDRRRLSQEWEALARVARQAPAGLRQVLEWRSQAEALAAELDRAEEEFRAEREAVRQAEVKLARERKAATQLRDSLPRLLAHPHPRVVDEEWERSTKSWRQAESRLRRLEGQHGVRVYLTRLDEALAQYQESRARARSALVRLLRYALLEDPEGMHEACLPLGRSWGRLGVTAREAHIRDLLSELEQAGQLPRLVERVGSYLAGRSGAVG